MPRNARPSAVYVQSHADGERKELVREYGLPHVDLHPNFEYSNDSMYLHCRDMISLSDFAYEYASLLAVARAEDKSLFKFWDWSRGPNEALQKALQPGPLGGILSAIHDSEHLLGNDRAVQEAIAHLALDLDKSNPDGAETREFLTKSELVAFHGNKEDVASSCVWGILKNDKLKRVTAVFRGSSSVSDFFTDIFIWSETLPNPVSGAKHENIGLHWGFAKAAVSNGKIEKILNEIAKVMNDNKGYKLFLSGHSLGGALATIVGFYAAADGDARFTQNAPVQIYSISSPRCGGESFLESFKLLEQRGLLRHARLYNLRDKVPMAPYLNGKYRHVGLGIAFRPTRSGLPPVLDYPSYSRWSKMGVSLWENILSLPDAFRLHGYSLVRLRLTYYAKHFSKMCLEDEYHQVWGLHNADGNGVVGRRRPTIAILKED